MISLKINLDIEKDLSKNKRKEKFVQNMKKKKNYIEFF